LSCDCPIFDHKFNDIIDNIEKEKMMKKSIAVLVLCVFLVSCQNNQTNDGKSHLNNDLESNNSSQAIVSNEQSFEETFSEQDDLDQLESKYYDQDLPGEIPVVFAEGIVSKNDSFQYPVSFSEDHQLMVYGEMDASRNRTLLYAEKIDGIWTQPQVMNFTGSDEMEAILSANGKIYFSSSAGTGIQKPSNLYYVTYKDNTFSKALKLPEMINSDKIEYYMSQSLNGNLYFTREGMGIYKIELVDGTYQQAQRLDFDSRYYYVSHPYISKDERYILFDARHGGNYGSADLYIAFNSENGFLDPINLGPVINTSDWDAMATLSPDEKYLFFVRETSTQRHVFWVEFNADDYRND